MSKVDRESRVTEVAADMLRALDDGDKIVCVWAGIAAGKTYGMMQVAGILCHTRQLVDPVSGERSPMRILFCASSLTKLRQNLMNDAELQFSGIRGAVFHADVKFPRWVFANGSEIVFRGFSVDTGGKNSIEGQKFGVIFSDETQELHDQWFTISVERARLLNENIFTGKRYGGQVVWAGRPQSDDRFLLAARDRQEKGAKVSFLHNRTSSNPRNPAGYEEECKLGYATIAEWEAACQIVPGATMPAKNSYYGDVVSGDPFDDGGSIIDINKDLSLPTTVTVDPGNETYSAVFWQEREVDIITDDGVQSMVYDVIVDQWMSPKGVMTTDEAAITAIKAKGYNLTLAVLDPFAANQRSRHADAITTAELFARGDDSSKYTDGRGGGLGCRVVSRIHSKRTSVNVGIDRVRARFRSADGERGILIAKSVWEDDSSERGVRFSLQSYAPDPKTGSPDKRKGTPSEVASHCADAIRYGVTGTEIWNGTAEHRRANSGQTSTRPTVATQLPAKPKSGLAKAMNNRLGTSGLRQAMRRGR